MTTDAATIGARPERRVAARSPGGSSLVARQELRDLWGSTRGLTALFGFSLLLAVLAYLASADAGINLLDARESVGVIVQTAIALGSLGAIVISADAISGERERGTLEALLVSPLSRRDLVVGKLLAATSMWAAALVVAVPFVVTMARGPGVAADALITLVVAGSLVAAALTALGLAISSVALSTRVSLAASLAALVLLAAPSQLPAIRADGVLGSILIKVNPIASGLRLAQEVLVNQRSWASQWVLLVSPAVAAVLLTAVAVRLSRRIELGDSR
ncbi:MAG: ABC transporter permease [Acidimicrobiia bacterium]|nr:ABC transporter permease [Acidimicrobiia bacterium]